MGICAAHRILFRTISASSLSKSFAIPPFTMLFTNGFASTAASAGRSPLENVRFERGGKEGARRAKRK